MVRTGESLVRQIADAVAFATHPGLERRLFTREDVGKLCSTRGRL
jgi:hypothetical protein